MTVGQRIRDARHKKGISMSELGDLVGTTAASISRYELGQRTPSIETIKQIATALDVDAVQLMGLSGDPTSVAGIVLEAAQEAVNAGREIFETVYYNGESDMQKKVLDALDKLNEAGQEKAVERVEELTEIPKYQKETPTQG